MNPLQQIIDIVGKQQQLPESDRQQLLEAVANAARSIQEQSDSFAKQAKIEAALEQIRSRTLQMQHSDEMPEVATLLFQQIQEFGVDAWSCGFNVWENNGTELASWMCREDGTVNPPFKVPIAENPRYLHSYESWKKGERFYWDELHGEDTQAFYRYLFSIPIINYVLTENAKLGFVLPASQVHYVANFSHGYLMFILYKTWPEMHELFIRFAQVFEQTYTRFLDLKKAEAQAKEMEEAYSELKSAQSQLIQSEKMASLGELTAGIAHEIQNPLNFVNNFSEVSKELLDEMKDELSNGNTDDAIDIANDLIQNLEKIAHHGKRADGIVKGMLQHSRSSTGIKESADINALCDEYLRLSYHGMRAKDKTFNATLKSDFDSSIAQARIIPQDIGRVILNLLNNAFYAVNLRSQQGEPDYEPTVGISTIKSGSNIKILVSDNGNGIPAKILEKVFQPFFTTKPTGVGTGLGLSLSYDIVTKGHGGELNVETIEGQGTTFILSLPIGTT